MFKLLDKAKYGNIEGTIVGIIGPQILLGLSNKEDIPFAWSTSELDRWSAFGDWNEAVNKGHCLPSDVIKRDFECVYWVLPDELMLIGPSEPVKASNGMNCKKCNNHFPYAEPNVADGFVCWSCKHYPFYKTVEK